MLLLGTWVGQLGNGLPNIFTFCYMKVAMFLMKLKRLLLNDNFCNYALYIMIIITYIIHNCYICSGQKLTEYI